MSRPFRVHPEVEARLLAAFVVGCVGAAAGEVYNALSPRGVFAPVPVVSAVPVAAKGVTVPPPAKVERRVTGAASSRTATGTVPAKPRVIDLAEALDLSRRNAAKFVDARSALRFASGHIPGAMSIPSGDFDAAFGRVKGVLPARGPVVVYCESADCDESDIVLDHLARRGYSGLMHFKTGWQSWEDKGLPQEQGAAP